jgi:SET domain-containing protein
MPVLEGLRVVPSAIHGYGVAATRRFSAGELIMYGDGILFTEDQEFDDEYALIVPNYDEKGEELPSVYWDLVCQSRWLNHSCTPNSVVDTELSGRKDNVIAWWTALRDIQPGEEITYDYSFSGHLAVPCNCNSAQCRGLIVDPDEIDDIPKELRHLLR